MVRSVSCLQALWTDGQTDGRTDRQTPTPYHNTSRQVGRIKMEDIVGLKLIGIHGLPLKIARDITHVHIVTLTFFKVYSLIHLSTPCL